MFDGGNGGKRFGFWGAWRGREWRKDLRVLQIKKNSGWDQTGLTANTVIEQNDGSPLTLVVLDALTLVETVSAPIVQSATRPT